jgi:hypothetical protein
MSDKMNKNVERMVKFAYIRDADNADRVLTIARHWGRNGNKIHYGYALCRPDVDQFRKDIGRTIASGRLLGKPAKVKPEGERMVLHSVMQDIYHSERSPRIVRQIAEQWLIAEQVPFGHVNTINHLLSDDEDNQVEVRSLG